VFVHGSLGDYRSWRGQENAFAQAYRVLVYSRRYHRPNPQVADTNQVYSPKVHAEDLAALLLTLDLAPAHIVGSSYGAYTAMALARDHPNLVRSLVLAEPPIISLLTVSEAGDAERRTFFLNVLDPARRSPVATGHRVRTFYARPEWSRPLRQSASAVRADLLAYSFEMRQEPLANREQYYPTFLRGARPRHHSGAAGARRPEPAAVPDHQRRAGALPPERHHRHHPALAPAAPWEPGLLQSRWRASGIPLIRSGGYDFVVRLVWLFTAVLLLAAPLAAQSRNAELLAGARAHIAAQQWDSADAELSEALEIAPYIMDSSWTYIWRGVLEYQRGRQQLARVSFRRALALHPDPGLRGLDTISTGLANLYDREFRALRTFRSWDRDQPARWTTRPEFVYPRGRPRRAAGEAIVRVIVDTSGRVEDGNIEIIAIPDSAFSEPLRQMMTDVVFTPARIAGKPVRSLLYYRVDIVPHAPRDPIRLIELARAELRAGHVDGALTHLEDAVDSVNRATPAIRVYAELVEGMAWQTKGDRMRAASTFDAALTHLEQLRMQGVDFAPFLRSLADSIRLTARRE
jgi:pimeloyl-ACP methyl ester carboxylesterase